MEPAGHVALGRALQGRETDHLAGDDAPVAAADPVDDQAAVLLRRLLPREVTGGEGMDLAVGHLDANVAAASLELSPAEVAALTAVRV